MASIEAATLVRDSPSQSPALSHPPDEPPLSSVTGASRSVNPRKRRRSSKPSHHEEESGASLLTSKPPVTPVYTPQPLTGAAALAEEESARVAAKPGEAKQTSPIAAREAREALMASTKAPPMSKLHDAPTMPATQPPTILYTTKIPPANPDEMQTSPQSNSSTASFDKAPASATISNGLAVASPGQMDDAFAEGDESPGRVSREGQEATETYEDGGHSNKASTFPGPINPHLHRTSSLPQSGYGRDNSISSNKRHKCPYCSTDFTRHHNLKSHLLTHSQEKPYNCDSCDSRFRRLHDLKRHAKLHTGERPHVCPKCDRSFARGDALARHNKGQGGCAGRRESMGSFGGDDRHDEGVRAGDGESMPGIMYTGEASHEPEHMDDDSEGPSGRSLPSIRKHDAPPDPQRQMSDHQGLFHARQPSTYPPVAARPSATGGLYPPPATVSPRGASGTPTSQNSISQYPPPPSGASTYSSHGPNVYAHTANMTESPKPLSPGIGTAHQIGQGDGSMHRHRSPSLNQQLQQQHYRRATGNNVSPTMSLPPPHPTGSMSNAPHLPPLQGLNPPDARYTLHSQSQGSSQMHAPATNSLGGPAQLPNSPSHPPGQTTSSANNSLSSHSTGPHGSIDRGSFYSHHNESFIATVESLVSRVNHLEEEVALLRGQGAANMNQK